MRRWSSPVQVVSVAIFSTRPCTAQECWNASQRSVKKKWLRPFAFWGPNTAGWVMWIPACHRAIFALQDTDTVVQDLVQVIREFRPHVIITYDENGGYPHPDHLKVHETSMVAWDKAGDPDYHPELGKPWAPLKLYYTHGFIRQRLQMFHDLLIEEGKTSPYAEILERWKPHQADIMARVTTQVPCAEYFDVRDDVLRAHATQIDPAGTFFGTPVDVQQKLWPTEEFELAATRVRTSIPEDDLFAGIPADSDDNE